MTAPLISDATLATIVRLVSLDNDSLPDVSSSDCMRLIRCLTQDRPADALYWARRDGFSAGLLRLLEEANEEAARTHDEREALVLRSASEAHMQAVRGERAPTGAVPGKITMRGEALMHDGQRFNLADPAAVKRAVDAQFARDPIASSLARATLERITKERDEARAELAATKKKLQGVLYGKRRRS